MEFLLIVVGVIISYAILYFVIKAAVRNGIIEARNVEGPVDITNDDTLPKIKCPDCNKEHDFDYPKCPYCGHQQD